MANMRNTRGHFTPNGLKVGLIPKALDHQRWLSAESRAAELLMHLQPSLLTLQNRYDVVCYLKRLLTTRCKISCEVFEVGSVPFKTYLPHGDIDLAAFTNNKDSEALIDEVRNLLETQQKRHDPHKFRVKQVRYIPAEVKILKFAVDNFIVDLSFNQLGGLCTLCFLDEVDNVIGQNHLFKRSVILIKAWCYFEGRTLGAYYRLMSTYALETLVIYIFHLYNKPFAGPLEVLFRFLEFFNRFDWDNYCLSLWGPVHKDSFPNIMRAEAPRSDMGRLMLSETFLRGCVSCYSVPTIKDQQQPFLLKFINIIDPLRPNNNLGRSISRGSAVRIKSAMVSGEEKLLRLVECAQDKVVQEFDSLFYNSWNRNAEAYWSTYAPNIHNNNNSQEQALQASYEDVNTAFHDSLWNRCQSRARFPASAWPEPFDADFLLRYLLEQEINNLKHGNRNNNNNVTPFSFHMDPTLLAHALDGDFQSHWLNMKNARLCLDGKFQGPRMLPSSSSSSSAELSQNHPLPPPRMQNVGPFYGPISGINNNHNSNKFGTGTFIPDPANYKSGINFHGRKRNYERGREGRRFNYEYGRTHHGNNAQMFQNNHNQRNENLVWRPIRTKPSMDIRNHNNGQFNASTSSSVAATAAGTNSQRHFSDSSSDWSSLPKTSRANEKGSTSR